MGLFENPYPAAPENQWKKLIHSTEAVQLARELDKESIVLLENHDETLPLKKSGNIAVIGPMADGFMNVSRDSSLLLYYYMKTWLTSDSTVTMLYTRASTGVSPR
jgi:beta-glucosidase-like glycosyl hydrolase